MCDADREAISSASWDCRRLERNALSAYGDDMNIDLYVDTIISVARKFEAYSCGDLDAAQAEEMVSKEA